MEYAKSIEGSGFSLNTDGLPDEIHVPRDMYFAFKNTVMLPASYWSYNGMSGYCEGLDMQAVMSWIDRQYNLSRKRYKTVLRHISLFERYICLHRNKKIEAQQKARKK